MLWPRLCQPADPLHPYVAVAPCCKHAYHLMSRHGQCPSDTHVAGSILATHIRVFATTAEENNVAHMCLLLCLGPLCAACSGAPSPSCQRPPAPPTGHVTEPCCRQAGNHRRGTGAGWGCFSLEWTFTVSRHKTVRRQGRVYSEYTRLLTRRRSAFLVCRALPGCIGPLSNVAGQSLLVPTLNLAFCVATSAAFGVQLVLSLLRSSLYSAVMHNQFNAHPSLASRLAPPTWRSPVTHIR